MIKITIVNYTTMTLKEIEAEATKAGEILLQAINEHKPPEAIEFYLSRWQTACTQYRYRLRQINGK